jgi:multidrug efflux pump subunit AcrA (membrane-fusion protein)
VVTFEVKVEVKGDDQSLLKPEMTANVEILAVEKSQVLQVPVKALEIRRNERFVTVRKSDGTEERKPVTIGVTDGVAIEIVSGLQQGDQVVISNRKARSRWQTGNGKDARRPHSPGGMMKKGSRK